MEEERIDVVLLDTEHPADANWAKRLIDKINSMDRKPVVLCTGSFVSKKVLEGLSDPIYRGYIMKSEIGYSLAWAVALATNTSWVITPSVERMACESGFAFPAEPVVLSGDRTLFGLSPQEMEVARLGILFNMPRDNLAHDMNRSPYTVYEYISNSYEKMGIDEIFDMNVSPREYFAGDQRFIEHFGKHIDQLWDITKPGKDKDTLAFHLMTIPVIH
jgi:DNA-binding NarL/FixJ family response regulator